MARIKALKLNVDLEIDTVTCPGVWLPNKGEILIRAWLLNGTARTTSVLPVFPLVYHENFSFQKVFDCQQLPELHKLLSQEKVCVELQQLRSGHVTKLADFECTLLTLLFPQVDRAGVKCSDTLALSMQPLFYFPGILPPKIEISTRTVIEEELVSSSRRPCISKTLSSQPSGLSFEQARSSTSIRQLARQAHSLRTPSPVETSKRIHRPPFVVRHIESDIFKLPPSPRSQGSSTPRSESDDECECLQAVQPTKQDCGFQCCTVCCLYRSYFGTNYPAHLHLNSSKERPRKSQFFLRSLSPCACQKRSMSARRRVSTCVCQSDSDSDFCPSYTRRYDHESRRSKHASPSETCTCRGRDHS